jgi:hypothetical protein
MPIPSYFVADLKAQTITADGDQIGPRVHTANYSGASNLTDIRLPPVGDPLSHGWMSTVFAHDNTRGGHAAGITVKALGAGDVHVRDAHGLWLALVPAGGQKTFYPCGNQVGGRWRLSPTGQDLD